MNVAIVQQQQQQQQQHHSVSQISAPPVTITSRNIMSTGQIRPPQAHVPANLNSTPNAHTTSVIRISPASSAASITNNSVHTTYQPFHPQHVPGIVTNSNAVILTTASIPSYNNGNGTIVNEHATIPKNGINSGSVHSWTTLLPLIDAPNKNHKTTTNTTSQLKPESANVPASHEDGDRKHKQNKNIVGN